MGRGALAAVALSVTVAGGAVLGTVAVVAGTSSATPSSPSAPVVASPTATTNGSGLGAPHPTLAPGSSGAVAPDDGSSADTFASLSASPTPAASPSIDPRALDAGFAGGYRFVAHIEGVPGLLSLGSTVEGTVRDADHFVLEFPASTFITRYTRHGATAEAIVNGRSVSVEPGVATLGDISPEDLMPGPLWAQAVDPWQTPLVARTAGRFAANPDVLVSHARQAGIDASRWQITAQTDGDGRLLTLAFSGAAWSRPFSLDLVVLYG